MRAVKHGLNGQEPSGPKAPRTAASQHSGDSLTTRRSLLRGKHHPKKQQRWTARRRTTTKSPGHAGVLQTKGTALQGVLKASTKNPGLAPLTPPQARTQSRASNKNNRNLESKRKASAKQADPPTPSLGLTPRSEAPAKHEEQPDLHEPKAAKSPLLRKPLPLPEVLHSEARNAGPS